MATVVVPSKNPLLSSPFVDPDESAYGELPVEKQLEIRVANATPGAGALVEARNSTAAIQENERVGETIELLDATTGWSATVGSVAAVATNPTGYGGNSLQYSPGSLVNPATGIISKAIAAALGANLLSAYSGGAILRVQLRSSNITALDIRIRFEKTGAGAWTADYSLTIPGAINTYAEASNITRGSTPTASTGTPWSSAPDKLSFIVRPTTGTQTYVVLFRDLRIGTTQTNQTSPSGHLAWESSYDWRVRYRDAASPTSTFGPWSAWGTFKVSQPPVVTQTAPADAATVTDPTPTYTWTYSSPGSKAQVSASVALYEVVGGQDQLVDNYALTGAGTSKTNPAFVLRTGKTYAWTVTATDTDGLSTTSARRTFTSSFSQPATPTGLTVTTDVDSSSALLTWTGPIGTLEEWRVYRRATEGNVVRISANGATWEAGDAPITSPTLTDYHVPEGVQVEYLLSAHSGSASSEGESATTSATGQLLAGRWVNVVPARADWTFELVPDSFTETPELQLEATEILDRSTIHTSLGELLEPRLSFSLFVPFDDLGNIPKLRAISRDEGLEYAILKSPTGEVWRVQYGTIPRSYAQGGNSKVDVTATVVST